MIYRKIQVKLFVSYPTRKTLVGLRLGNLNYLYGLHILN